MNELVVEAALENADAVQAFISSHIENFPPKAQNRITIAVDEIFSNIASYAYSPGTKGTVAVRVAVDNEVTIEFEDSGTAYDPLSGDAPDITLSVEEREIGGLGLFMVKNIMDTVTYRRDGGKNILTIKKGPAD